MHVLTVSVKTTPNSQILYLKLMTELLQEQTEISNMCDS